MYSAGTAFLTVVPSFKDIEKEFSAQAKRLGQLMEESIGKSFDNVMSKAGANGRRSGDEFGGAFEEKVKGHLDNAEKAIRKIKVDADTSPLERAMAKAREEIGLLRDAKIGVDLNEGEFFAEVERVMREVQDLDHEHASIELRTNAAKVLAELRAVQMLQHQVQGGGFQAVDAGASGGAHVDTSEANAKLSALSGLVDALNKRKIHIPVDIDATKALASVRLLSGQIDLMNRRGINIPVKLDSGPGIDGMRSFGQLVDGLNKRKVKISVSLDIGKATASLITLDAALNKFNTTRRIEVELQDGGAVAMATELRNTLNSIGRMRVRPDVKMNTAAAIADLKTLDQQINRLNKKTLTIDVKVKQTGALGSLTTLENRVSALDGRTITIHVNMTGVASALATLAALSAAMNRLQRQNLRLGVGSASVAGLTSAVNGANQAAQATSLIGEAANFSIGRLGALIAVGATLGTVLVPAAAAAAASVSAIATAAAAAAAGIGVFALGIFGVIKAVAALNKAANDQAKANKSLGQSENQVANALDGVRDAQEQLVRTRDEVARGAARAARTVVDAQQQVIDAERDALKAEQDLMRAKIEAQRQDEDRAFSLRDNALAQRQAILDITDAKNELDKVLNNKRATADEREQARITYEQQLLQLERLKTEGTRLVEDQAQVQKDGADVVVAAQERVADSQRNVAKAQQDLADAIQAQTQQQIDGQRQLLDAQQAVVRSQRALQQAYLSTATAGGAAMQNLQQAMAGLSPAAQKFAKFIFSLKQDFKDLQHAAEGGMLPGLQTAIEAILPFLPAIKDFVGRVATALGETFVMLADTLKDPVWQRYFGYLDQTAAPALKGMAGFTLNVATGLAGIVNSLSGFNGSIGSGLLKWSEMFRDWASNLDTNKGFQAFIAYVRESGPRVLEFFRQLWVFATRFVEAAAPIGKVVLEGLVKLFELINKIPIDVLTILIATISGVAAAFLVFAGVAALVTSPVALIILGIAAVVAAFAILYVKVKPFREFIDATLRAIADAAVWLWQNGIKPAVDGIVWLWQNVLAPVAVWLWKNVLKPAFDGIAAVIGFTWNYIIKPIFDALVWVIQNSIAPTFSWLWDHVIKPVWTGIEIGAKVMWAAIEVIFGLFQIGLKLLGAALSILWVAVFKPIWGFIAGIIEDTWNNRIKPVIELFAAIFDRYLKPAFQAGLEALGNIWDGLVNVAKIPIKFLIETVLNDGLLAAYNWIAKKFGVKPDDVHITLPSSFYSQPPPTTGTGKGQSRGVALAAGGYIAGPGGPTDDLIQAWLSNGEYVIPANVVRQYGVGYFDRLIGGDNGPKHTHMYADGGLVGTLKLAWNALTDPVGWLKDQARKLFDAMPGGEWVRDQVIGLGNKVVDGLTSAVSNILSAANDAAGGSNASVAGIVGNPNVVFPPWPSSPGASRGDSGVWRNVVALIKSTGPLSGAFGNSYRPGDPLWHGSGRAVDWMGYNQDALATFLASRRPLELIHRSSTRDYAYTRGVNKGSFREELMQEHRNHVHIAMDSGGMLPLGWSAIYNGTGGPEPVLTGRQWATMSTLASRGAAAGPSTVNNFQFRDTTLTQDKLNAIQERQAIRERFGRAR